MGTDEMINDLTKQLETLKNEFLDKEQFLKIQGALEALNAVKLNNQKEDVKSAK